MRIENPRGHYSFLRGIAPYSGGVAAHPGFEIEHAAFLSPAPLAEGFRAIASHLAARKVPKQALCAMELRSPRPFTLQGFQDFNAEYVRVLKEWGVLLEGGTNPVARTNVAPELFPPPVPSIHGFSYSVPSQEGGPTFVVAGSGELPEGLLDPHDAVRRGETSASAMAEKARFVMAIMGARIKELEVDWRRATTVNIYTVHEIASFLGDALLKPCGGNAVTWNYARPPIHGLEFEMDVRGVRRSYTISLRR